MWCWLNACCLRCARCFQLTPLQPVCSKNIYLLMEDDIQIAFFCVCVWVNNLMMLGGTNIIHLIVSRRHVVCILEGWRRRNCHSLLYECGKHPSVPFRFRFRNIILKLCYLNQCHRFYIVVIFVIFAFLHSWPGL